MENFDLHLQLNFRLGLLRLCMSLDCIDPARTPKFYKVTIDLARCLSSFWFSSKGLSGVELGIFESTSSDPTKGATLI